MRATWVRRIWCSTKLTRDARPIRIRPHRLPLACQVAADQALWEKQQVGLIELDPALPYILDTDTSSIGTGAMMAQEGPEGERVVAYYSRTFNKAERHYYVTQRELLAIVVKYYLCGLHFTVRTDHSSGSPRVNFLHPGSADVRQRAPHIS